MFPNMGVKCPCPFSDHAMENQFPCATWKDLAGNAMHTGLLGYVFLYFISTVHVLPRDLQSTSFATGNSQLADSYVTSPTVDEADEDGTQQDVHVAGSD